MERKGLILCSKIRFSDRLGGDKCTQEHAADAGYPCEIRKISDDIQIQESDGEVVYLSEDKGVKTITGWTFPDDGNLSGGELALPGVNAENQADFDTMVSMLPTAISAEIEGEAGTTQVDIIGWSCPEYMQDENGNWPVTGEYVFTAELPEGYACDLLPTVKTLIGGVELYEYNREGYSFDENSGKLTVDSNAGTTNWRRDPNFPGYPDKGTVKKLEIKANVTAIGEGAFQGCTELTSVTLADDLKAGIMAYAFQDCKKLESITIPSGVTAIGAKAFQGCTELTSVTLADDLKAGIMAYAFQNCKKLESITIPSGVTAIGEGAFQGCNGLTEVILGNEISVDIGPCAFQDCSGLTKITIPDKITNIWDRAFQGCTNLVSVIFKRNSSPSIGNSSFSGTSADLVIHVPEGAAGYNGANWPIDKIVEGLAMPLTNLTISDCTLTPAFRMGEQTYTATVSATVTSVKVTPSAEGTITVNGKVVDSDTASETINLKVGKDNRIEIVVKTDDMLKRIYTVTITREKASPTLTLNANPGNSQTFPGDVTLTASLFDTSGEMAGKIIEFTGSGSYTAVTNDHGVATYTFTNLLPGTYNFGASFTGDAENESATAAGVDGYIVKSDIVSISNISGVVAPTRGGVPVTSITETQQYTGTVSWLPAVPSGGKFAADTEYTATITLTPKVGYTLQGVVENFFTVAGAAATNDANSGVITAVFPKTAPTPHSHSYGDWKSDGTDHWRQCSCGSISDKASHDFSKWTVDQKPDEDGKVSSSRECTVCGYKQTEKHVPQTLTDPEAGVTVKGDFTSGAAISVKEAVLHEEGNCKVCDEIRARQADGELIVLYDISLTSGINSGEMEISIPVDEKYNGQTVILLHCMDKEEERLEVKVEKGLVTFTTKSLSPFAVLDTKKAESIKLASSSLTLEIGKSRQLTYTVTPENIHSDKVTWTTSDKKVATVSPSGKVQAVKAGTAAITCTAADGGGAKATCKVTVKNTATPLLNLRGTAGKNSIRLNWNQVSNADGYEIYGSRCGSRYSYGKVKTITKGSMKTWTQKGIRSGTAYKYYIKAYKLVNGKKLYLKTSLTSHVATTGSRYTNTKTVTTTFTDITLAKGKTRQISARITPVKKGGKLANHVPEFRYKTTNSKVATVNASGKITAAGKGKCSVYVYANNGVTRRIMITVK